MNFLKIVILTMAMGFGLSSFGENRGIFDVPFYACDKILDEGIDKRKISRMWSEYSHLSISDFAAYGQCLVYDGQIEKGMNLLDRLIDNGNISSAIFVARWQEARANFDHPEGIQEMISAHLRVFTVFDMLIRYDPASLLTMALMAIHMLYHGNLIPQLQQSLGSPAGVINLADKSGGFLLYKSFHQTPELYFLKFTQELDLEEAGGLADLAPDRVGGDERKGATDSLYNMKNYAEKCIDNMAYLEGWLGFASIGISVACHLFKDTAEALLPLEAERNRILSDVCASGDCSEYQSLRLKMDEIISSARADLSTISYTDPVLSDVRASVYSD